MEVLLNILYPSQLIQYLGEVQPTPETIDLKIHENNFNYMIQIIKNRVPDNNTIVYDVRRTNINNNLNSNIHVLRRETQYHYSCQPFMFHRYSTPLRVDMNILIYFIYTWFYPDFTLNGIYKDVRYWSAISPYLRSLDTTTYNNDFIKKTKLYNCIKKNTFHIPLATHRNIVYLTHLIVDLITQYLNLDLPLRVQ